MLQTTIIRGQSRRAYGLGRHLTCGRFAQVVGRTGRAFASKSLPVSSRFTFSREFSCVYQISIKLVSGEGDLENPRLEVGSESLKREGLEDGGDKDSGDKGLSLKMPEKHRKR